MDKPLQTEHLTLLQAGVAITLASANFRLIPSVAMALAAYREPESGHLRILARRAEAQMVIEDALATRQISTVACQPSSHKTVQIKGELLEQVAVTDRDLANVTRAITAFAKEIVLVGFDDYFAQGFLSYQPSELTCLVVAIQAIFDQTPGAQAGTLLSGTQPCA
ncbi:hypothetical protein [Halioxenophilus sp. WMMB6]|uniref:hypothetical protein n=1 Tax=Halioxenophilus sp. WMMB6 TaxID=3073815 RepID=UPI00295E4ED1|nr:hypothetical protein [Halioxenophilus sp. WMMB6]